MERAPESENGKERGMCPQCVDRKREVLCEVEKYPEGHSLHSTLQAGN